MQKLVLKLGDVKQPRCPGEMNRDMSLSAQVSQLSGTSYWPDCIYFITLLGLFKGP